MERTTISIVFSILASLLGVYSILIVIRIILTWFSGFRHSKPVYFLSRVTDPYLNWWRSTLNLRLGVLDLSPIIAMSALTVMQTLCSGIAAQGRLSLGIILTVCLYALRSVVLFIIGFCLFIVILRLIAYISGRNIFGPFWSMVDAVSRPLLYRINRIIFGKRLVRYTTGIVTAIIVLAVLWAGVHFGTGALAVLLRRI